MRERWTAAVLALTVIGLTASSPARADLPPWLVDFLCTGGVESNWDGSFGDLWGKCYASLTDGGSPEFPVAYALPLDDLRSSAGNQLVFDAAPWLSDAEGQATVVVLVQVVDGDGPVGEAEVFPVVPGANRHALPARTAPGQTLLIAFAGTTANGLADFALPQLGVTPPHDASGSEHLRARKPIREKKSKIEELDRLMPPGGTCTGS